MLFLARINLLKPLDALIRILLFGVALYGYTVTLAPTVLAGDAALFQYTPHILGVTYPTGFPLYILIGKLWLLLFPIGEIAWRMNFLSAFCAALALPLLYSALRRLFTPITASDFSRRLAALSAVLTFATIPTFWRWATEAKTYPLNILLFCWLLYEVSKNVEDTEQKSSSPLLFPAFLLGLQISVHNTAVLLIPGLFLLTWFYFRAYLRSPRALLLHLALLIIPGLFYLYIPLRAEGLITQYGRDTAIAQGRLADFYHSGWQGLIRYYTAQDFTTGVVTNWGEVPHQFVVTYLPLLRDNLTQLGMGLGFIGAIILLLLQPRLFWPLFLIYAIPIPFVLTYGQGEQSAFLLPSFLIFSIFVGSIFILMDHAWKLLTVSRHIMVLLQSLIFISLIILLFLPQIRYNYNWLEAKWDRSIYEEWDIALNHPLESKATFLAEWGDLTSFWYMQHAENRRPDLLGLYPPTEAKVEEWYAAGGDDLYIAGPLPEWAKSVDDQYELLPWGRLVRMTPAEIDPQTLLPELPHQVEATFSDQLRLVTMDYPDQAVGGSEYPVALTWQALADLSPQTTLSLRLSREEAIIAQRDDSLISGWFPYELVAQEQYGLSYMLIPIPLGTLPGSYRLQLVAYTNYKAPWSLSDGSILLDLGEVDVVSPPSNYQRPATEINRGNPLLGHSFEHELELVDFDYTASRVGQGKGFGIKLLWRAKKTPSTDNTLLIEVVDKAGNIVRSMTDDPVDGQLPTSQWQSGQFIRDQVDIVLSASAPVGQDSLQVRLSWLRPDGSKLPLYRWFIPIGENLNLDTIDVTEKEDRVFTLPERQYKFDINFENKARFLGYNQLVEAESREHNPLHLVDKKATLQISQSECETDPSACQLFFDFYWQGLSEMDHLYFVFLHLVDEEGNMVTQHDRSPGKRGKQPTTSWLPGEIITDPIDLILPADISPGQYTLRLGIYLPPMGPRLSIFNESHQSIAQFAEIGLITIKK